MKRKFFIIEVILLIMLNYFGVVNVYASNISINGGKSLNKGSTETITITIPNDAAGKVKVTSSNSNVVSVSSDMIWCEPSTSINVEAKGEGTATITATCYDVADNSANELNGSASLTITVKGGTSTPTQNNDDGTDENKITTETKKNTTTTTNAAKSRNNYLSSLKVSSGKLTPGFNRETTDYTIKFDDEETIKNLDKITIKATAADKKSKITGTGEKTLNEGENSFTITVTAENGDTRDYVIKVTKPTTLKESDLRLSSLDIQTVDDEGNYKDASLDKAFDSNTFEYSLNVENNIKSLNVSAIATSEEIEVSTTGNEDLHEGINEVIITLKSKDDETIQTTYKIVVNKAENVLLTDVADTENLASNNYQRNNMYIASAICLAILILIILLIIWYRKSRKDSKDTSADNEKYERNMQYNLIEDDDVIINDDEETANGEDAKKIEKVNDTSGDNKQSIPISDNEIFNKENSNEKSNKESYDNENAGNNSKISNKATKKKGKHF